MILCIEALTGLVHLVDESLDLQPYVKMNIGTNTAVTRVLPVVDSIIFEEAHELALEMSEPLTIGLYDRDDFGRDVLLSAHCIPYYFFDKFKCPGRNIKLKLNLEGVEMIEEDEFIKNPEVHNVRESTIFSTKGAENRAVLEMHICFMDTQSLRQVRVRITSYDNIRTALGGGHTIYNLELSKYDGAVWRISLRFSQIQKLRKVLMRSYPEVEEIEFPETTIWSWLFKSNHSQHKLNASRTEARKCQLETFLNTIGGMEGPSNSKAFKELLQVPE